MILSYLRCTIKYNCDFTRFFAELRKLNDIWAGVLNSAELSSLLFLCHTSLLSSSLAPSTPPITTTTITTTTTSRTRAKDERPRRPGRRKDRCGRGNCGGGVGGARGGGRSRRGWPETAVRTPSGQPLPPLTKTTTMATCGSASSSEIMWQATCDHAVVARPLSPSPRIYAHLTTTTTTTTITTTTTSSSLLPPPSCTRAAAAVRYGPVTTTLLTPARLTLLPPPPPSLLLPAVRPCPLRPRHHHPPPPPSPPPPPPPPQPFTHSPAPACRCSSPAPRRHHHHPCSPSCLLCLRVWPSLRPRHHHHHHHHTQHHLQSPPATSSPHRLRCRLPRANHTAFARSPAIQPASLAYLLAHVDDGTRKCDERVGPSRGRGSGGWVHLLTFRVIFIFILFLFFISGFRATRARSCLPQGIFFFVIILFSFSWSACLQSNVFPFRLINNKPIFRYEYIMILL